MGACTSKNEIRRQHRLRVSAELSHSYDPTGSAPINFRESSSSLDPKVPQHPNSSPLKHPDESTNEKRNEQPEDQEKNRDNKEVQPVREGVKEQQPQRYIKQNDKINERPQGDKMQESLPYQLNEKSRVVGSFQEKERQDAIKQNNGKKIVIRPPPIEKVFDQQKGSTLKPIIVDQEGEKETAKGFKPEQQTTPQHKPSNRKEEVPSEDVDQLEPVQTFISNIIIKNSS